jgi:hypothetical protein
MTRVTVACHADDLSDARALAAYLNGTLASLTGFVGGWETGGQAYFVASGSKSAAWLERATQPVGDRPEFDTENAINMTGAGRAWAAMIGNIWTGPGDDPDNPTKVPTPGPGKIVAVVMDDGVAALHAMGLARVEGD